MKARHISYFWLPLLVMFFFLPTCKPKTIIDENWHDSEDILPSITLGLTHLCSMEHTLATTPTSTVVNHSQNVSHIPEWQIVLKDRSLTSGNTYCLLKAYASFSSSIRMCGSLVRADSVTGPIVPATVGDTDNGNSTCSRLSGMEHQLRITHITEGLTPGPQWLPIGNK